MGASSGAWWFVREGDTDPPSMAVYSTHRLALMALLFNSFVLSGNFITDAMRCSSAREVACAKRSAVVERCRGSVSTLDPTVGLGAQTKVVAHGPNQIHWCFYPVGLVGSSVRKVALPGAPRDS